MALTSSGWRTLMLVGILGAGWMVLAGKQPSAETTAVMVEEQASEQARITRTTTVLSPVYSIDKTYRSMMGPYSEQEIVLDQTPTAELLWITGYSAEMVGEDGSTGRPRDLMCHSNLDIDVIEHEKIVGPSAAFSPRLFTLSQGQLEVDFPIGFGIPVASSEALSLTTQVLNLNAVADPPVKARHKVSIDFLRESESSQQMLPLMPVAAYGLAAMDEGTPYFGVEKPDPEEHGPGCLPGANASDHTYVDPFGRKFTGHWVVPPGRQVNRTLVTQLLQLPYDTTIHYIAVHLHPFAESLVLRDLTSGTIVFESEARNFEDRIGLDHVQAFSSREGIRVHQDHEYELVSTYNNTSAVDQDSMAVMYIYVLDKSFDPVFVRQQIAAG